MKRALKMWKRTVTMLFLLSQRRDAIKRHSSAASLVLAVLAVLGLAGPVAAGEQVPFTGSFAGVATITPVNDTLRSVAVDATGTATELGPFTLAIPHYVNLATSPWTSFGSYQFVAANGDTLFARFIGKVTPVSVGLSAVEIAHITRGTGRFVGASGGFTVERLVYTLTAPRTTIGSFNGTISFPGAAGG
jgi:hypothetical protein